MAVTRDEGVYADDLSDPVKVADSYIRASILNDLERTVFYWTGDREAHCKTGFGRAFPSLPAIARRNNLPLEDYHWRLGPARIERDVARVRVELEAIQTGKIAQKYREFMADPYWNPEKQNFDRKPKLRPDLTIEEAWRLARSYPSVGRDRFEHDLRLNRTEKGWLIDMEADDRFVTILYQGYDPDADPDR